MIKKDIRFVAIYLRKSRGDEEHDLQKHRNTLTDLCKENNYKYIEYAEIGTSDSIELRPIFKKLLAEIESEIYDAIVVMDIDRLSRGDKSQQGTIENIIKKSETLIITPSKVYDLNNAIDEDYSSFKSFFSNLEYKTISRRLRQGKVAGAKMGNWTNGIPPFPYEYQKWGNKFNEKGLVVNDDKLKVYRFIIDNALENVTPQNIAVALNQMGERTAKGNTWSNVAVYRLLIDETHLGKIITNKSKGDGHKVKKSSAKKYQELPRSQWNIVENCHQAVKTQIEHDKIINLIQKRQKVPKRSLASTYELSGLITCGVCGYGMTFQKKANGYILIKPCWHIDPMGHKCPNRGGNYADALGAVKERVDTYIKQSVDMLQKSDTGNYDQEIKNLQSNIFNLKKDINKYTDALDKVNDAYDLGDYSREDWLKRKEKWENQIYNTNKQIDLLARRIYDLQNINPQDQIKYYNGLMDKLKTIDIAELNSIYKQLIKSITWTRLGEDAEIEIEYN